MDRFVDRVARKNGCNEGHGGIGRCHPCRQSARSTGPGYF